MADTTEAEARGWTLSEDGKAIEKTYRFGNFIEAFGVFGLLWSRIVFDILKINLRVIHVGPGRFFHL